MDEQQDIFKHWSSIPWLDRSTKKSFEKTVVTFRNIIGYLKDILPSEMTPNIRSPEGLSVINREAEEQSVLRKTN